MQIGFDGKRIFQNSTGLGNYARLLVNTLIQFYPENQYSIFAPKETSLYDCNRLKNIHLILPKNSIAKKLPTLWRSRLITKDIALSGVNIYHGLSNELPIGINKINCKTIVTIHDLIFERYPETYHWDERFIHQIKVKRACAIADTIIAISEQTKKDLIQYYNVPLNKIVVCYQSCNPIFEIKKDTTTLLSVKQHYNLPNNYFLFVSSITKRKNLITICKAMVLLKDKLQTPLVVIGNGKTEKHQAIEFMQQNGLENQIIFLNDLPQSKQKAFTSAADFPAIYQQATALIYPSIFEGFGLPILEAMWSGLPVICSNNSSLPEVAGEAALYFSPLNENELAKQMLSVATNNNLTKSLISKGYAQANKFSLANYAKDMIDIYQNTL